MARERAAAEVSDVLLNLDHALARARRTLKVVQKDEADLLDFPSETPGAHV